MRLEFVARHLLLFAVLVAAKPSFQTFVPLSGTVEDETKQPVSAVQVTLHSGATTERTTTNDLGQFRFDSVPFGNILLDFDKPGFFRLSGYMVMVTVTAEPTEIAVALNHEYEVRS